MPHKKYLVTLTDDERQWLTGLVSAGKRSALTITRARILLKADQAEGGPAWKKEGTGVDRAAGLGGGRPDTPPAAEWHLPGRDLPDDNAPAATQ